MSLGRISSGKIIVRAVEATLAVWIVKDAVGLYHAGKQDAAVSDVILAVAMVAIVETLLWLIARRSQKNWSMSSDEVFVRGIQVIVVVAMIADAASWLIAGEGFGVNHGGCALATVILEGIIRRFVRPDPRPPIMAQALKGIQAKVKVFTHLPPGNVRETIGLVRGISDIEASSRRDFKLAEQEALYPCQRPAQAPRPSGPATLA